MAGWALLASIFLHPELGWAQATALPGVAPPAVETPRPGDRPLSTPEFLPLEPPSHFELPSLPPTPPKSPMKGSRRFVLQQIKTEGNSIFEDAELATMAEPYLGKEVGIEELARIRQAITLKYVDAGYVNSGAIIPDQRIIEGVVTYRIVEGKLSEIEISGNDRLQSAYLEGRLRRGGDAPLNIRKLQDNVLILLQNPSIDRLNVELGPGAQPGEGKLRAVVEEGKHFDLDLTLDNSRAPSVGGEQIEVQAQVRNFAGWGEEAIVRVGKSSGFIDFFGSLSAPINAYDTKLYVSAERSSSNVVEQPFSAIDVASETTSFETGLRHPVYRTPTREFSVGLSLARRESETFLLGRRFNFSPGVDSDGESRVTAARLALDFVDRSQEHVFAARSTISLGLPIFGATDNSGSLPDSEFLSWLGQVQYLRRINEDGAHVILRAEAQVADDPLLSLEKFAVGGFETVRGYRENQFVRDNGVSASVELRVPIYRLAIPWFGDGPEDGRLQLAPFFDVGQSWDNSGGESDHLLSLGIGLRWLLSRRVTAELYYGEDLREVTDVENDDDLQDHGVHFRLRASLY